MKVLRTTCTEDVHAFNGNGYTDEWLAEAARRGLTNLPSAADALPMYNAEKNVELFVKHGIYTKAEIDARAEIHIGNYTTVVSIEAKTMVNMIRHQILPAVSAYTAELCSRAAGMEHMGVSNRYASSTARELGRYTDTLMDQCAKIEKELGRIPASAKEAMKFCHDAIIPAMDAARETADAMEMLMDIKYWPFPVYSELLFSV